ncbi:MAG: Adaptive-response sensory-kinase SasA [Chroococcidiopsis cubana SAG 39.79]|jgi:DICT domain-containing protein/signal transduction histidine kinase|uniref:histidine kinase n=2 Tax=Chroococcidiopsis TaxID=54298 RepID=A0AB37UJA8_9CYAN|nr:MULTISPECIES: DICT sensory domain-containing protein [Chroococcidiopsis]MDZ4876295.1 Adaptive-response sensory-kinase SasA [Chroococcidiopsis cubana SAG 39.79]PSM50637.1 histidine kinase [Chroococcidiopsis sp. CCALA 051]RUT11444.1 sensor histidine kinase [Chroococcidiopsis cubana SAG 39.79]URD49535.1 ATP-binding protein [Chroococcidiopsis sp. CCNUC1]
MSNLTSVLSDLLVAVPQLRPQVYFKASLTALSHAMEDQVLASTSDQPLLIASFQRERFYRQEAHRYKRLARQTNQVYVLAAPETDFTNASEYYETIAFDPTESLSQEWHLVAIGQNYSTCLICRERPSIVQIKPSPHLPAVDMDPTRQFEGIWTSERQISCIAAELLLQRILHYRPELAPKIELARDRFGIFPQRRSSAKKSKTAAPITLPSLDPAAIDTNPFVQRLVTYLQAGQYKLLKAYRSIAAQERKERLINSITAAIRKGSATGLPLHPQEILKVAVRELGIALAACRCLIYRAQANDDRVAIAHEYLQPGVSSVVGKVMPLQKNPLFQEMTCQQGSICIVDTQTDTRVTDSPLLQQLVKQLDIRSWLLMPVLYQGKLLGIVESHYCGSQPHQWTADETSLVEAIATQVGAALIQAEAYANLEDLNQQLEALDRTRSNLIAITGHELRTPLSTIQVCLESLATEPDMPLELRQVMLSTALTDSERMRKLVQDFLTLSNLESGRVEWHPETLPLDECVELALSRVRTRSNPEDLPQIVSTIPVQLPLIRVDGDWLVELIAKLLDNACKFTPPTGQIAIAARTNGGTTLEVTVSDTGRGIEPNRLEIVFDRFYQEEGALRRTAGGTGLGLAICRQIVNSWNGKIWAESAGKDKGSTFHFTIPTVE